MKYTIKRFSVSPRTKAGFSGMWKGAASGVGIGGVLGTYLGSGMNGKQKLALSLASMIMTVPFGAWAGYKAGTGVWDQENAPKKLTGWDIAKEKRKLDEESKKKSLQDLADSLSRTYPELSGLQKIDEDKELKSLYPDFGDGDEYPIFNLCLDLKPKENFIPILRWHYQQEYIGINPIKKIWCTEDYPGRKINIKTYLLKTYQSELKDYKDAKSKNSYGWEDEEYDQVILWIECVIKKIRQSM